MEDMFGMFKIIDLLVMSTQDQSLKEVLLHKYMEKLTEKEHSPEDFVLILNQLKAWILTSNFDYLKVSARKSFSCLVQRYRSQFLEICNREYITDLFNNQSYCNKSEVVILLMVAVKEFKELPVTNQPRLQFFRTVSVGLLDFLKRAGGEVSVSSAVVQMYRTFPETRPERQTDISSLCKSLVTILSRLTVPSQLGKISQFRQEVLRISSLLPEIWDSSGRREQLMGDSLHTVYTVIVDTGGDLSRSPCLGYVLDQVSVETVSGGTTNLSQEQTVRTVSSLLDWLGLFPFKRLDQHTLAICGRVASVQPELVRRVAREKLVAVMKKLSIPLLRPQLEPVFMYLAMSNQSCPVMMNSVCSVLPSILFSLQVETSPASKESWRNLAECAVHLLSVHSGLGEKGEQLRRATERLPELSEDRREQLKGKDLSCKSTTALSQNVITFQTKQVGLINLGNTCYMNCIIQALFNTVMFRSKIFSRDFLPTRQPVLASLQNVFIFLRYSSRNIFSPSEFLRLARPSWFEAGRQQDCSELLTHLLDTLQEEEKSTFPRQEEEASQDMTDQEPEKFEDNDEIMKSCENVSSIANENDSNASDEEAKDTVEDQVMLKISKKESGSSSSLGLSRWSTEENLSVGDSKEGLNSQSNPEDNPMVLNTQSDSVPAREEPCETQSTGSDSGIHSVESVSSPQGPLTIVQKVFGGRMVTSFHCSQCQNKSEFSDWFTDIHLPIPQSSIDLQKQELSKALQTISTSASTSSQGEIGGGGEGGVVAGPSASVQPSTATVAPAPSSNKPRLPDLLSSYFEPERLIGDNKYFCEGCDGYQEAERRVSVSSPPECLVITLLRFKYDTTTQRRVKIMTGVEYPQYLQLPVLAPGEGGQASQECYKLYGVVVHSGYTSDGGHYYTWIRSSENNWRILNDSTVVENQDWNQFVWRTSQNSSQTPYLLLFNRIDQEKFEDYHPSDDKLSKVKLDNMKFVNDNDRGNLWRTGGGGVKRNKDEDDDSGAGGSGNCHDNFGQIGGGRFVC